MDNLRIFLVTWNVATKSPDQDLNSLLDFPSQHNKNKVLPDFYIIGLQEVKSQPQNMVMDALFTDPWTLAINKILCRQDYKCCKTIRLQGILLLIYTQMKHLTNLRDIEAQYTKTGLGGLWGNKGAVTVRFNIYGCSLCFVNCHLTAHEHLLADRIKDYNTIINQQEFHVKDTVNILYHDYVFWLGDLNFRNDHPPNNCITSEDLIEMLQKVEKDKYETLINFDQLKAVMQSGEAFSEFTESAINFPPTYKFNSGSDDYDVKRKPSWTDRILYKVIANNYENITLKADVLSYNHVPHYTVSDHKPVIAQFNIKMRRPVAKTPTPIVRSSRSAQRMRQSIQYASPDGINEEDNCICDDETFSNYTEKTVEFEPITRVWYIGDVDFRIQCTLSPDVEVNSNDWIGVYDADFQNLDDYIVYEYLAKVCIPHSGSGQTSRIITLRFPVGSGVRTPGFYRFIYFSQPSSEIRSVLGISDPFEVSSPEDQNISIDPCTEASTSRGTESRSKRTTTTDIFNDFTGLDVARLSRHFSHDLSID